MGIRMHLSVGYGLDLEQFAEPKRSLSWENLERPELREVFLLDAKVFAEKIGDTFDKIMLRDRVCTITDLVVYDGEFGLSDKALLIPIGQNREWSRYGDLLDIFAWEAEGTTQDMTARWTEKPGTLYPYVGLMRANSAMPLGIEKYWEPCYLDSEEHQGAIPWAPWHLWFWIKHVFATTDEATTTAFLSLRPTIYRHWS